MAVSNFMISLIQGDIRNNTIAGNLNNWQRHIENISDETQLIVLPEMFNTGFMNQPDSFAELEGGATLKWMQQQALIKNTAICGSFMVKEKGKIFNRFYFVYPNGYFRYYDKFHLFRFGGETDFLSEGKHRIIIEYLGWKIFPMICYDLRFPVFSYNRWTKQSGYEYDLMLVCASWPASRAKVWDALLKARAIENQCYVAAVNRVGTDSNEIFYNGHTQLINAKGIVKSKITDSREGVISQMLSYEPLQRFRESFCTGQDQKPFTR